MARRSPRRLPWHDVIEQGRGEQLVREARYGARPPEVEPAPGRPPPGADRGARCAPASTGSTRTRPRRSRAAREGHTIVTTGTASGKSLAFNLPVLDTLAHDRKARALYLYPTKALAQDQARKLTRAAGAVPAPRDLRRRHAEGGARRDPPAVEPDPHEPRHAQRVRAAEPPPVGRRAREPRLDRGRRGARLPRRVRLARGERAAPPAPRRARLRHRAALRAHERDDRQPARAGRGADRPRPDAGRPRRRAARRAPRGHVEPGAARREVRQAPLRARRGRRPAGRPGRARRADDLLHEVAPRRRADAEVREAAARGRGPRATSPSGSRPTARATRRSSAARSSGGWPRASCWRCARRARSSSASTSASSTPRSASPSPARSRQLRQMWGRAGRRRTGLAMYVAGEDGLDQFFCRHPDEFLDRAVEGAILDYESEEIHLAHLAAAAYELPLTGRGRGHPRPALGGLRRSGSSARRAARARGVLHPARRTTSPPGGSRCASSSIDAYAVVDRAQGELVGTVEAGARVLDDPPGRGLHAPGRVLRGRRARAARPPRARRAVPRRLVHAAEDRDRHVHRGGPRAADARRRRAELRDRVGVRGGRRLPAQARDRPRAARPASRSSCPSSTSSPRRSGT